jgi:hypothetical protein
VGNLGCTQKPRQRGGENPKVTLTYISFSRQRTSSPDRSGLAVEVKARTKGAVEITNYPAGTHTKADHCYTASSAHSDFG